MIIIMLGAPGSGKGTVGNLLSKKFKITHISSGEIFRSYINKHNKLAEELKSYITEGRLVPNELAIKLVEKRLSEPDVKNGMILDGYPRTEEQAIELDELLGNISREVSIAVNLVIPDEEIVNRVINRRTCENPNCREIYNIEFKPPKVEGICDECGSTLITRIDDTKETVEQRLKTYHEISEDLIKYYSCKKILYTVKTNTHSNKTAEDIAEEISKYLGAKN